MRHNAHWQEGKGLFPHYSPAQGLKSTATENSSWVWNQRLEPQFPGIFHHRQNRWINNADSPRNILQGIHNVSFYISTLDGQISRLSGKRQGERGRLPEGSPLQPHLVTAKAKTSALNNTPWAVHFLVSLAPRSGVSLPLVFINEVLLKHRHAHQPHTVHGRLCYSDRIA